MAGRPHVGEHGEQNVYKETITDRPRVEEEWINRSCVGEQW